MERKRYHDDSPQGVVDKDNGAERQQRRAHDFILSAGLKSKQLWCLELVSITPKMLMLMRLTMREKCLVSVMLPHQDTTAPASLFHFF